MNTAALHDALDSASRAVLMAESGRPAEAGTSHRQASAAAAEAFEPGTPEASALSIILGAVAALPSGVPCP